MHQETHEVYIWMKTSAGTLTERRLENRYTYPVGNTLALCLLENNKVGWRTTVCFYDLMKG
jgi:hypothetical protein